MDKNYSCLKKICQQMGAELFGVADIVPLKSEIALSKEALTVLSRAICLGVGLSQAVLEELVEAPNRLYFHHYKTLNTFLDQLALKVTLFIQRKGFRAIPIPASQIVDWEKQTAHLSHKKIGALAGIGWIGRNNLLVNKKLGSQFRLATILTDMPLKVDQPCRDDCARCRACIEPCPAGAIKDSAADFDGLKCFEKLKSFQKQRLVDQYICGVCVCACKGKDR